MNKTSLHYYKQVIATLDKQVANLQREFKGYMSCKKGCSSCCQNVNFKISYIEALQLAKGFASLPGKKQQQILENLASSSSDCPFLVDNACAAYASRPVLCRSYGLLVQVGDNLGTCSLNFNEAPKAGESFKKLDLSPYYDLLDELSGTIIANELETLAEREDKHQKLSIRQFMNQLIPGQSQFRR